MKNIKYLIKKYNRLIKFALVGVLNTSVDFIVFMILIKTTHFLPSVCQAISYSCGMINSYILNKLWTFKHKGNKSKDINEVCKFVSVNGLSIIISCLLMDILIKEFNGTPFICKIIITGIIQVSNYIVYKSWVFKIK